MPHHTLHCVLSHLIVGMLARTCPQAGALFPKSPNPEVQATLALGMFSGPGARLGTQWACTLLQSMEPSECTSWFLVLRAASLHRCLQMEGML